MIAQILAETGGEATVGQLVEKNKLVCATPPDEKKPFECLDLTYLSVLLTEAYGLDKDTTIDVRAFVGLFGISDIEKYCISKMY